MWSLRIATCSLRVTCRRVSKSTPSYPRTPPFSGKIGKKVMVICDPANRKRPAWPQWQTCPNCVWVPRPGPRRGLRERVPGPKARGPGPGPGTPDPGARGWVNYSIHGPPTPQLKIPQFGSHTSPGPPTSDSSCPFHENSTRGEVGGPKSDRF